MTRLDEPDSHRCAETGCSRPSEPGCECCRFHEWAEAMRVGDMELAAQWFGEMTDVEQREAQGEYAAARSALDKMADVDAAATGDGDEICTETETH